MNVADDAIRELRCRSRNRSRRRGLRSVRRLVCAGLVAAAGCAAQAQLPAVKADEPAHYNGKLVRFLPASARRTRTLVVGDLRLGTVLSNQTPSDHRPNLYVICPGFKFQPDQAEAEYSIILNTLPRTREPVLWDVYWVAVLNPGLSDNLTSEDNLLMAAQTSFTPGPDFDFSDIPGVDLLRKFLHIDSRAGLGKFELTGGDLPALIVVPAHVTVRAGAYDPEAPEQPRSNSTMKDPGSPAKNR